MKLKYEQLGNLPLSQRQRAASIISAAVCREAVDDKMKFVTPRELLAREFSLVALDECTIAGHVSVEESVVGALYVDPVYRGNGIARVLVSAATDFIVTQGLTPVAYCNQSSVITFSNCGYQPVAPDKPRRTKMMYLFGRKRAVVIMP